jgi:hypothetical protein
VAMWLKGAGRSNAELARLLIESNGGKDTILRHRRAHDRYPLTDAFGTLIYEESKIPCQVLEISVNGCSLLVEKPFRPGALAPVEIVLPILGMVLHIGGVTQWINKERHMGIHFNHVNSGSRHQLESLIACIRGQSSVESVKESIASREVNLALGDVLAVQALETWPETPDSPPKRPAECSYNHRVHAGGARLHVQKEGKWPVVLRSPEDRFNLSGFLVDLSLGGCTVQIERTFAGKLHDQVEVGFQTHGLCFQISGIAEAAYNAQCLGIRFNPMSHYKQEELALLMLELCAESRTPIDVG